MDIALRPLLSKLNNSSRLKLEAAVHSCMLKKGATVELEHWLVQLLNEENSAISYILVYYDLNLTDILKALASSQLMNKTENVAVPSLSRELVDVIRDGWMIASVEFNSSHIHSGHLLLAILSNLSTLSLYYELTNLLKHINLIELKVNFSEILKNCSEVQETRTVNLINNNAALDAFTSDMVEAARNKKLDRAIGRKNEVNQAIDILCRRKQNNPILVGEAGVGKTAIVEELAFRIAEDSVPDLLKQVHLRVLDLTALQAGASIKGEFEQRLKNIISEIKKSPKKVLLFIDEIHNLIGVGSGTAGQNDAANLLKPELARGEIFVIGATTWAEYKKYFEKDSALTRRFQLIKVKEPTEEEAIFIARNAAHLLEEYHGITILDQAIEESVKLTSRYLNNLYLPDKAISLLDSACTKVKLEQTVPPVALQKAQEQISLLNQHIRRSIHEGIDKGSLEQQKTDLEKQYNNHYNVWKHKTDLITELNRLKQDEAKEVYLQKQQELNSLSQEKPTIHENVNTEVIAEILSNWTGIPIPNSETIKGDISSLLGSEKRIQNRVIGQDHAIQKIMQRIRIAKANISDPRKPIGVFLLIGESGVGKTETALSLAEVIYGSESKIITINMSEYKEPHKVSSLIGSPPGYIGYGEGGKLTEQVRRNPYSVILLDEIEKAHSDVQELFLQVFDKGTLTDSEGVKVSFKNAVIIMTSNLGASTIKKYCETNKQIDTEKLVASINPDLLQVFKPEFLGRINVIPFLSLNNAILKQIVSLQLTTIKKRIKENYKAKFSYDNNVINKIISKCRSSLIGARAIEQIINNDILSTLSTKLLEALSEKILPSEIILKHKNNNFLFEFINL